MKKLYEMALWFLGVAAWGVLLGFTQMRQAQADFEKLTIHYAERNKMHFSTPEELWEILLKNQSDLREKKLREINTRMLEEILDAQPAILKSEVFSTVDQSLIIKLIENEPLARVMGDKSYYIIADGAQMPLSPYFAASVPLIHGKVSDSTQLLLSHFLEHLRFEPFFKNFISGIYIDPIGNWELIPSRGDFRILLGKPKNLMDKMTRLQLFYERGLSLERLDSLASVNLKFENQIICRNK